MITSLRRLTERVWISGQIDPAEMTALAAAGFTWIVNHRPDGEESGQPTAAEVARAATGAGLRMVHAPAHGLPDAAAVMATREVLDALEPDGKALFFCRSGMRSAAAWALAERANGGEPQALRDAAAAAGYDLTRVPLQESDQRVTATRTP